VLIARYSAVTRSIDGVSTWISAKLIWVWLMNRRKDSYI
jgi:hypothetical protein